MARVGNSCPLLPLSTETPSGLDLGRHCACCHHFCESVNVSVLLGLEGLLSLVISIPPGSYNVSVPFAVMFPESGGEKLNGDIPFKTFTCCTLSSCGSLYLSPSTVEETSLMLTEQDTYLWG